MKVALALTDSMLYTDTVGKIALASDSMLYTDTVGKTTNELLLV